MPNREIVSGYLSNVYDGNRLSLPILRQKQAQVLCVMFIDSPDGCSNEDRNTCLLLTPVSLLLTPVSSLLTPASSLLNPVSLLLTPVSSLLTPFNLLLTPVVRGPPSLYSLGERVSRPRTTNATFRLPSSQ
jgi:hypothetical protein